MSNSFGKYLTLTLFGESHGPYVGATLDGFFPGVKVDQEVIAHALSLRRPSFVGETQRVEKDEFQFISGVFNGSTTGEPITILIPNKNVDSSAYENLKTHPRPGHADFVLHEKSNGYNDYSGGGHSSGRVSAPIVALAALAEEALKEKGIRFGGHILSIGNVQDRSFNLLTPEIETIKNEAFPTLDDVETSMKEEMEKAAKTGDSIGGSVELAASFLPIGLGEPWFASLDGQLANAFFSIGGVKGVEFGNGFEAAKLKGSQNNDPIRTSHGYVYTTSNNAGGINGGISNGMPVVARIAIKPTPSISLKQDSIDMALGINDSIQINGRHDPCIVRRAFPVLKAMMVLTICDAYIGYFGRKSN